MTINRITDTPLINKVYGSRGLISNNFVTKNCVRMPDGTLYAVVGASRSRVRILRSTTNGFSWETVRTDVHPGTDRYVDATNVDGPIFHVVVDEQWNKFRIYFADYDSVTPDYDIIRISYVLDELDTVVASNANIDTSGNVFDGVFDVAANHDEQMVTYIKSNQLVTRKCSPRSSSVGSETTLATTPVFNMFGTEMTKDSHLYIVFMHQTGGANIVKFYDLDVLTLTAAAPDTIVSLGNTVLEARDISVAVDNHGTICAVWSQVSTSTEAVVIQYATSINEGTTWDVNSLTQTASHSDYADSITSDGAGRTSVIASSSGGFMFTYTEDNASSVPKSYVRQLTTSDSGATYDLGAEAEIATSNVPAADSVVGAKFFTPPADKLMDLADPGLVRVAYQIGEGNSATDDDTDPVDFGQELLFSSAYPSTLTSEATSYSADTGSSTALLVDLNVLPGPNSNDDFYTLGATGPLTTKYLSLFSKMGTSIRVLKYEPVQANLMNDRSAYDSPVESNKKLLFDPQSYSFPTPSITAAGSDAWIERDVRKVFLPPDKHLSRTFTLNAGGYLKRTVWTCEFDGNEYEISQVVPRFISGQICYYEANAYVVGPSRDPFSRAVLPSET